MVKKVLKKFDRLYDIVQHKLRTMRTGESDFSLIEGEVLTIQMDLTWKKRAKLRFSSPVTFCGGSSLVARCQGFFQASHLWRSVSDNPRDAHSPLNRKRQAHAPGKIPPAGKGENQTNQTKDHRTSKCMVLRATRANHDFQR